MFRIIASFISSVIVTFMVTACRDDNAIPADSSPVLESEVSLIDIEDAPPATPVTHDGSDLASRGETEGRDQNSLTYDDLQATLFFGFDKTLLTVTSRNSLATLAAGLKQLPGDIVIEGHTDERGRAAYNKGLGMRRAQSVASFLEQQGVSRIRMRLVSYGSEKPDVPGMDEETWAKNRRVRVTLVYED